jgi:hypothetical protein
MKKKLPIGLQSFRKLREEDFLYIDKTEMIHRMVTEGNYYFLSRPRRFGKSLTLSTIRELFSGHKELFAGLWVERNWNWDEKHPIIHISFSSIGFKELGLEKATEIRLREIARENGLILEKEGLSQQFEELIKKLSVKNKVVLLIDEYDKPIIDFLDDIPHAKANQQFLKTFYSIIKDADIHIRFLLITGVSKFSKVSIFSELNNLNDLTIDRRFADMLGYTQTELEFSFDEYLMEAQKRLGLDRHSLLQMIRDWYNGYSWDGKTFVYNPFSILNFFQKADFQNFWFSTGTPTFLIKLLRDREQVELENIKVDQSVFESYDLDHLDTLSLMFQTGYTTIKSIGEFGIYTLDYPNKEVKESMLRHLIGEFRHASPALTTPIVVRLRQTFLENDLEEVITIINGLFKSIPSHLFIKEKEAYYHSIVFLVFQYLGQFIEAEAHTSDGRADAVVQTQDRIYILEFKLDKSAREAMEQIRAKGYAEKYKLPGKEVVGIGINFSSSTKSVAEWLTEVL